MSPEAPPPASQPRPEQVEGGRQGKQPARGPRSRGHRARAPGHRGALPEGMAAGPHRGRGEPWEGSLTTRSGSCPAPASGRRGIRSIRAGPSPGGRARRAGSPPESAGAGAGRALGAGGRRRWALLRPRGARVCAGARAPRAALRQVGRRPGSGPGPGAARDGGGGAAPRGAPAGTGAGAGRAGGGRGPGSWRGGGASPSRGRGVRGVRGVREVRWRGGSKGCAVPDGRLAGLGPGTAWWAGVPSELPGRAPPGFLGRALGLETRAPGAHRGKRCPALAPAPAPSCALSLALMAAKLRLPFVHLFAGDPYV